MILTGQLVLLQDRYWIFNLFRQLAHHMEIQEAANHFKKLFRSLLQSHDSDYMWNIVVNVPSSRLSGSLCSTCNPLLRQSVCNSNGQQSCFPWMHQAYRNWLPYCWWKSCSWAFQTSFHFLLNTSGWHLHQTPSSQYL